MLSSCYGPASPDVVHETFDGDIVVLDLACGKYFSFNDSGSVLWEAVVGGYRLDALVAAGEAVSEQAILAFLQKLISERLVSPLAGVDAKELPSEMIGRLELAKEAPDLFVYDDLADLFLADPIHDVEEQAGWPVVRPADQ